MEIGVYSEISSSTIPYKSIIIFSYKKENIHISPYKNIHKMQTRDKNKKVIREHIKECKKLCILSLISTKQLSDLRKQPNDNRNRKNTLFKLCDAVFTRENDLEESRTIGREDLIDHVKSTLHCLTKIYEIKFEPSHILAITQELYTKHQPRRNVLTNILGRYMDQHKCVNNCCLLKTLWQRDKKIVLDNYEKLTIKWKKKLISADRKSLIPEIELFKMGNYLNFMSENLANGIQDQAAIEGLYLGKYFRDQIMPGLRKLATQNIETKFTCIFKLFLEPPQIRKIFTDKPAPFTNTCRGLRDDLENLRIQKLRMNCSKSIKNHSFSCSFGSNCPLKYLDEFTSRNNSYLLDCFMMADKGRVDLETFLNALANIIANILMTIIYQKQGDNYLEYREMGVIAVKLTKCVLKIRRLNGETDSLSMLESQNRTTTANLNTWTIVLTDLIQQKINYFIDGSSKKSSLQTWNAYEILYADINSESQETSTVQVNLD